MPDTQLSIYDLQKMCHEHQEESVTLEFKPCNELKVGTEFHDKRIQKPRQRDDILDELTKDVSAFLNSAGGTLIYGIREKKSRAESLDRQNSFKSGDAKDDIRPEKIIDWIRAHVQPRPSVNAYRVFENPNDPDSPWYLVIEMPQGQLAYMAKDHRFYKRVGNIPLPMEQYEVSDVMNRTRAAALDLRILLRPSQSFRQSWNSFSLDVAVTSANFIASEYGALKITVALPIQLNKDLASYTFGTSLSLATGLLLEGEEYIPHAQSGMLRWGANSGNVVFPGDWYNFHNHGINIDVPGPSLIPDPTYLVQFELFTLNSLSKKTLYAVLRLPSNDDYELVNVDTQNYQEIVARFWSTYHAGLSILSRDQQA